MGWLAGHHPSLWPLCSSLSGTSWWLLNPWRRHAGFPCILFQPLSPGATPFLIHRKDQDPASVRTGWSLSSWPGVWGAHRRRLRLPELPLSLLSLRASATQGLDPPHSPSPSVFPSCVTVPCSWSGRASMTHSTRVSHQ